MVGNSTSSTSTFECWVTNYADVVIPGLWLTSHTIPNITVIIIILVFHSQGDNLYNTCLENVDDIITRSGERGAGRTTLCTHKLWC